MSAGFSPDEVLYGDHQRTAGSPGPPPLQYGLTLPYDHEILTSGRSLILLPSLPGTGAREQLRSQLIAGTTSHGKLVICPKQMVPEWKQDNPDLRVMSQEYARLHIHLDELREDPPELLIIEDPHGAKTVPLLQDMAFIASRSIIRAYSGRDTSQLWGFPGELLDPLSVNTDIIDGI